jgi:hypothetical protein
MRGPDPRIHRANDIVRVGWIAGSSPAMTIFVMQAIPGSPLRAAPE